MDLEKAIEVLEISDIDDVQEDHLAIIRRNAKKRWHPDTITHQSPSEEKLKRYQYNFGMIDQAIEMVRAYINGDLYFGNATSDDIEETESSESILRRNADEMQAAMRGLWHQIKQQGLNMEQKVITVIEGRPIKDLLKQDIEDNVPLVSWVSFTNASWLLVIAVVVVSALTSMIPALQQLLQLVVALPVMLYVLLSLAVSLLLSLPLARFWMNLKLGEWLNQCVTLNLKIPTPSFLYWPAIVVGGLMEFIILKPFYYIALTFFRDKKMGGKSKEITYYAGVADWHINELLERDVSQMSWEELKTLSHLYSEYCS